MKNEADNFLSLFAECLDPAPDGLGMISPLATLENFDSLARISVIAMIDTEYAVILEQTVLDSCATVEELFELVKEKKA